MGHRAEREDDAQIGHRGDLGREIGPAGGDLRRLGLVLRRHAAHGVGDPAVDEAQPVIRARRRSCPRRSRSVMQRRVEQVAGIVAGERPAGAVGAAQARREPDDQQPRRERPEGRHRRVVPVGMSRALHARGRRRGAGSAGSRAPARRLGTLRAVALARRPESVVTIRLPDRPAGWSAAPCRRGDDERA